MRETNPTNSHDLTPKPNSSIEPERLLKILDQEIELIQKAEQRPGWTLWALLGTLGGALWLLFNQLESTSLNLENIPILFLSFSLFMASLALMYSALSANRLEGTNRVRFRWSTFIGEERPYIMFELIRCLVLVYLTLTISRKIRLPFIILIILYYGTGALLMFIGLILSFLRIPLGGGVRRVWADIFLRATYFFLSIGLLWASWEYFSTVVYQAEFVGLVDFRVSALIVVIIFLLHRLMRGAKETPLLANLIEIRRDFAFGNMDMDTAIQRTDIALLGMKGSDVLQEDVREILDLFEQMDSEGRIIVNSYQKALSLLPKDEKEFSAEHADNIVQALKECNVNFENRRKIFGKIIRRRRWFEAKYSLVKASSEDEDISELRSKIDAALDSSENKIKSVSEEMDKFNDRFKVLSDAARKEVQELDARIDQLLELTKNQDDLTLEENERYDAEILTLRESLNKIRQRWLDDGDNLKDKAST